MTIKAIKICWENGLKVGKFVGEGVHSFVKHSVGLKFWTLSDTQWSIHAID